LTLAPPALQREWRFTRLALFIWAWMLVAPRLEDRWLVQLLLHALLRLPEHDRAQIHQADVPHDHPLIIKLAR
jgi:hypothetical protein